MTKKMQDIPCPWIILLNECGPRGATHTTTGYMTFFISCDKRSRKKNGETKFVI
jgi:hypothetical protein